MRHSEALTYPMRFSEVTTSMDADEDHSLERSNF